MRILSVLFLLALVAVFSILFVENYSDTRLSAWKWGWDVPLPLLVLAAYVLGMLSGWWMLGMVTRSWRRATEPNRV